MASTVESPAEETPEAAVSARKLRQLRSPRLRTVSGVTTVLKAGVWFRASPARLK